MSAHETPDPVRLWRMVLGFWEASSGIHSDGGSDDSDGEFASAESGEESREDESGGEEEEQISRSVSSGSDIDPAERYRGCEVATDSEASEEEAEEEAEEPPLAADGIQCPASHRMQWLPVPVDETSLQCDDCTCGKALGVGVERWCCVVCDYDICKECADESLAADGAADSSTEGSNSTAVPAPAWAGIAERLRCRGRGDRSALPRDWAFREWQAERAAANAPPPLAAGSGSPSSPGAHSSSLSMVRSGSPLSNASAAAAQPSSPDTPDYMISAPPAGPLAVAPAGPELRAQVRELLERDRELAVALAQEIFRQCRTSELARHCDALLSSAPALDEEVESHPAGSNTNGQPTTLTVGRMGTPGGGRPPPWRPHCECCDEMLGDGDTAKCPALSLLDSLHEDLEERDAIVERELEEGCEDSATLRAARWYMYRLFVARQYGHLGQHVRVRIPDCAVAAIRSRYRAPGCTCIGMRALAACTAHGYVGYKER